WQLQRPDPRSHPVFGPVTRDRGQGQGRPLPEDRARQIRPQRGGVDPAVDCFAHEAQRWRGLVSLGAGADRTIWTRRAATSAIRWPPPPPRRGSAPFPNPGDADRIRQTFEEPSGVDCRGRATPRKEGAIHFAFPNYPRRLEAIAVENRWKRSSATINWLSG